MMSEEKQTEEMQQKMLPILKEWKEWMHSYDWREVEEDSEEDEY